LLAGPTAACGQGGGGGSVAQREAAAFAQQCRGPEQMAQAPDEAMRRHLERLCSCTEAKIAATPIAAGESGKAIEAKVSSAISACLTQVGAKPGEGRPPAPK
jgi:hypothetical protein